MTHKNTTKTRLNRFKKSTGIPNPDEEALNKLYDDPAGAYQDVLMFFDLAALGKIPVPDELKEDVEHHKQSNGMQKCLMRVLNYAKQNR